MVFFLRPSFTPKNARSTDENNYKLKCVICGKVQHKGIFVKYRICNNSRAPLFREATSSLQDEVFIRVCDLQSSTEIFGADLY